MGLLKKIGIATSVLVVLLAGFKLFWKLYDQQREKQRLRTEYQLSPAEVSQIQNGDIILRYGYGMVSDYIVNTFNEKYKISHCGVIWRDSANFKVIHSESSSYFSHEGAQAQDFFQFVANSQKNSVMIVRFNKHNGQDLSQISRRARYYLNKKVPFDYAFDMNDSSEMYCAEIIWHVFLDVFNQDIYQIEGKKTNYSQFANFYDPAYFDIVINHHKAGQ